MGWVGIAAGFRARASLVAANICLRQQLLVLRRRQTRPRIGDVDRRFWVLARRWFSGSRRSLLIVEPVTVLMWHRWGWGRVLAMALKTGKQGGGLSNNARVTRSFRRARRSNLRAAI